MKFSELLGEPEPERERDLPEESEPISVFAPVPVATPPATTSVAYPTAPPEPVAPPPTVAPVPPPPETAPPAPPAPPALTEVPRAPTEVPPTPTEVPAIPRSGLAEVNVRQEPPPAAAEDPETDALAHLEAVVDDLLPSRRGRK